MKRKLRPKTDEEPIGIVISSGPRGERAPVVSAYVWGPAPELPAEGEVDA